jgi:ribosomal protein S18 acetylase RimI-like enzyme
MVEIDLIVSNLNKIHSSLSGEFYSALDNNHVIKAEVIEGYGSEVMYYYDNVLIMVYYYNNIKGLDMGKFCDNIDNQIENLDPEKYEIITNNNYELVEGFLKHGYREIDMGSEYQLNETSRYTDESINVQGYDESKVDQYIDLIDTCFNPLRMEMGKSINYRRRNFDKTVAEFKKFASNDSFITFYKDQLIGLALVDENRIDTLVINQGVQSNGYGSKALKYLSDLILNKRNYKCVKLNVVEKNKRAKKFYEKHGYKISAEYRVFQ